MARQIQQPSTSELWALARQQHGVVTRAQLLDLGYSRNAIEHRLANGRLHPMERGVYAVGRPQLMRHGAWLAAVLGCGPDAVLSHASAAALWEIRPDRHGAIEVSVTGAERRRPGLIVHRRRGLDDRHTTRHSGIPVTSPACTIVDIAPRLSRAQLEAAINEADKLDLIHPAELRFALPDLANWPGVAVVRQTLDRRTFTLTDSQLERLFLPLVRAAGLALPITREEVNGFRVDFFWPDLGLVVETDGLRYHRTPAQQARDRRRDQAHTRAGLTPLRFTHEQVKFEPAYVQDALAVIARRLEAWCGLGRGAGGGVHHAPSPPTTDR